MAELRVLILVMLLGWASLCCVTPPPVLRSLAKSPFIAMANPTGTRLVDATSTRAYVAVPIRLSGATSSQPAASLTRDNWSWSVRQKGRVQVFVTQTPDFFAVIEQELPRGIRNFGTLDEAIADANHRYSDWPVISLEP